VVTLPLSLSLTSSGVCVYGFTPPSVEHVCDNQSDITITWKEKSLSIFDKTKPDSNVIMVARSAISELQQVSTVKAVWVSSHADKRGPPYPKQEELNIMTDILAERSQIELPDKLKPRHGALHSPEQQISVVISHKKVASRLPLHIANMIHGPTLHTYTTQKEGWSSYMYESITWESFATAFNKLTSAQQITMTKTIFSFWCTNSRHRCDRGQLKDFCFCDAPNEDWRHVLTCNGMGAIIYRTGSWDELRRDLSKFPIHQHIWLAI
jgi:hypothetical protein